MFHVVPDWPPLILDTALVSLSCSGTPLELNRDHTAAYQNSAVLLGRVQRGKTHASLDMNAGKTATTHIHDLWA